MITRLRTEEVRRQVPQQALANDARPLGSRWGRSADLLGRRGGGLGHGWSSVIGFCPS
jgi:hypothetical protein